MDKKRLEEYCRIGEKADEYLRSGKTREALKEYSKITDNLEECREVDSYLMAKVTLGFLRAYIKLGDFKRAYEVWNANLEDGLYGVGIYALESAQTTVRDMLTYDMVCAFLHSLADKDPRESANAVNQYLSRVCEQTYEEGDRKTMLAAISNWKQHLREIFKGTIPHDFARSLIRFEKLIGESVKAQPIDFPLPTPWEKPSDFREMSRVVSLKSVEGRGSLRKPRDKKVG